MADHGVPPFAHPVDRLWAKVEITDTCWLWTGARSPQGYGQMTTDQRRYPVHRVLYEFLVGPVPSPLELDHLCRVRHCVNPTHQEPVTHGENVRRGYHPPGLALTDEQQAQAEIWAAQLDDRQRELTCRHGHPWSDENIAMNNRGRRFCRPCTRRVQLAHYYAVIRPQRLVSR